MYVTPYHGYFFVIQVNPVMKEWTFEVDMETGTAYQELFQWSALFFDTGRNLLIWVGLSNMTKSKVFFSLLCAVSSAIQIAMPVVSWKSQQFCRLRFFQTNS